MGNLVSCFERLIDPDWVIPGDGAKWLLEEKQAGMHQHARLEIRGGPALIFSLDKPGCNPWPFIRSRPQP